MTRKNGEMRWKDVLRNPTFFGKCVIVRNDSRTNFLATEPEKDDHVEVLRTLPDGKNAKRIWDDDGFQTAHDCCCFLCFIPYPLFPKHLVNRVIGPKEGEQEVVVIYKGERSAQRPRTFQHTGWEGTPVL
ncbi:MAG: hypothetical protein Q7S16_00530 [bacterium]|nr:hypothetical protein [bacterium]